MAKTKPPTSIDTTENMESKILRILADTYPNLDCGPGTPMYEMVVRPTAMLWTRQATGIEELTRAVDLANFPNLPNDDMERLVSRYFIERRKGIHVVGTVRVYFINAQDIYIAAGDVFEASHDRVYEAINSLYLTSDELLGDSTNGYYVDVTVQSIGTGSQYNASMNETVTVYGSAREAYSKAFFSEDTTDGGIAESNYNLYQRTADQLSARNLDTYKGAVATIREAFPTISEVTPIGIRDDEMIRDQVNIRGYGVCHIGGKCDIYIRPSEFRIINGYKPPIGFPMSFKDSDGTYYSMAKDPELLRSKWNSLGLRPTTSFEEPPPEAIWYPESYRGSLKEDISMLSENSDGLTILTTDLSDVDKLVQSSTYTSLHSDTIVKQKWPLVVYVNALIEGSYSEEAMFIAKTTITSYINNLSISEAPSSTEIIYLLRAAGINTVHLPVTIYAYYLTEQLKIQRIGVNGQRVPENSLLIPIEDDSLKFIITGRSQMSLNTCCWYTNNDLISIEVR